MLTQAEIDFLLNALKELVQRGNFGFPTPGSSKQLDLVTHDGKEKFIVDINRRGRIKITKCTYQKRYRKDEILLRLDIDGPPHTNPDGQTVPPNHLHICREGFGDSWAYPLPNGVFSDTTDLINTLIEFLEYCRVTNISDISIQGGFFS